MLLSDQFPGTLVQDQVQVDIRRRHRRGFRPRPQRVEGDGRICQFTQTKLRLREDQIHREEERIDRPFGIDLLPFFPYPQEQGLGEVFHLGVRPAVAAHKAHHPVQMRIEQGAEGFGVAFPEADKQCG